MDYPFERVMSFNKLYNILCLPICEKYHLTNMEFNILMFLENNPQYDTAADIVKVRRLAKSHVSIAVRSLTEKGLLLSNVGTKDRRVLHLEVSDAARCIVSEGSYMQDSFMSVLMKDFSDGERQEFKNYLSRISDNINHYLLELSRR